MRGERMRRSSELSWEDRDVAAAAGSGRRLVGNASWMRERSRMRGSKGQGSKVKGRVAMRR